MRKLKPQDYLDEFFPSAGICTKTVVNWIKSGKINGEQTPTGRWLVLIKEKPQSKVNDLVKLLESAA